MTNEARVSAVITQIVDGTPVAGAETRVCDAFVKYRPDLLKLIAVDPESPTAEENAEVFMVALEEWSKSVVRKVAESDKVTSNSSGVTSDGDAAEADLD